MFHTHSVNVQCKLLAAVTCVHKSAQARPLYSMNVLLSLSCNWCEHECPQIDHDQEFIMNRVSRFNKGGPLIPDTLLFML